jgi:hypothetical protein
MSTKSNKQCPNCKRCWFTTQESFKHHIRHCRRANCVEKFNDIGSTAANPLLSNFTPELLRTVFQQSNLNQSDEDEYEETEQKADYFASNFDSDSWGNNDEKLKEDMDNNTSF